MLRSTTASENLSLYDGSYSPASARSATQTPFIAGPLGVKDRRSTRLTNSNIYTFFKMVRSILFILMVTIIAACTQAKNATQVKPQLFKFTNDTLSQIMKVIPLNKDTFKVSLETINKIRNTRCTINGMAIRDTVGDFLHEEETEEIEKNVIIPVKYFIFSESKGALQFVFALDNLTMDKIILQGPEKLITSERQTCYLRSVGILKKQ